LLALNPNKASRPDGIPAWLPKENADLLTVPVADILTVPFKCAAFQSPGKEPVSPPPKTITHTKCQQTPSAISLTFVLSKVAEEYVVKGSIKPAVMNKVDRNQFGTVPNSCTTHAFISVLHSWYRNTDGKGSTVRVVLFDFKKAFDLIDPCARLDHPVDRQLSYRPDTRSEVVAQCSNHIHSHLIM